MNIFKLAFELFIIYMVYKLIFDFIIPVYNTTRQMKQKMAEMHQKMHDQQQPAQPTQANVAKQNDLPKKSFADDYIEYEEVK